jgi:hypothetical protein
MRTILFSFLLLFPLQKTQVSPQKPADQCTLQGVVVKAESGEPLKKALVRLREVGGRDHRSSDETDETGRFEIRVDPGRYRLLASHNGYIPQLYGERAFGGRGSILTVAAGQKISDLTFRLTPAAVITGHVYDEDGEPLAEARVLVLRRALDRGQGELVTERWSETNDRGEFRAFGLPPGQYYVRAESNPDEERGPTPAPGGYLAMYYPGTSDAGRASPVIVHSGEEIPGIDITLQPVHTFTIRGRVLNSIGGRPSQQTDIVLVRREPGIMEHRHDLVTDPQGAFEIRNVSPGSYSLHAMIRDGERSYAARMPVEVTNADIDGVTLTITRGLDIRGQLRTEGATLASLGSLNVHVVPKNESRGFGHGGEDSVKGDGSFLLGNVADGDYDLYVSRLPEGFFLKSARLDGNEVLSSGITIDAEQAPKLLEIVVSANGAQIEGVVQKDQQPFSGAAVVLVPDSAHRDNRYLFDETTTDQYGHFLLRGIAPGDYKLFAWENVESGAYRSAGFLQAFEERGRSVQVTEGARLTVQLDLIPAKDSSP